MQKIASSQVMQRGACICLFFPDATESAKKQWQIVSRLGGKRQQIGVRNSLCAVAPVESKGGEK